MKNLWRWLIAAMVVAVPVLAISGTAVAATAQNNGVLTLSIKSVSATSDALALSVQAGAAASGQKVEFFVQTQEFSGHGWMSVGSTLTNSSGEATYTYTPTWTGETQFGAALGSDASMTAPTVVKTFEVLKDPPGVPQSVIEYARPLGSIGGVLVKSLLAIVAIIWITLLGSLALVIRRMPRLAEASASKAGQMGRH